MFKLKDSVYDSLKWVTLICLPALGTAYVALSGVWGFPYAEEISRTAELERKRVGGGAKVKPKAKAMSPLSMIAREASEAGMTYGRYVARKAACAPSGGFSWKHTTAFGKRGTER